MFWYSLLAVLAVLFVLSVALPVPRRIWAFSLITAKYIWLWFLDVIGLGRMWFAITGRSAKYQKLTRPVLLRMMCEDLGPTFIKFGQIIASSAGMFTFDMSASTAAVSLHRLRTHRDSAFGSSAVFGTRRAWPKRTDGSSPRHTIW